VRLSDASSDSGCTPPPAALHRCGPLARDDRNHRSTAVHL